MPIPHKWNRLSCLQVDPGKQGNSPKTLVFIISADCFVIFIWRKILRCIGNGLYAWFLIIGEHMSYLFILRERQ